MAWDDTDAGDGTVTATEWNNMVDAIKNQQAIGHVELTATGDTAETGVGFQPAKIFFYMTTTGGMTVDAAGTKNGDGPDNYQGTTFGYAIDGGTSAFIHVGGSGNSINSVSKYSGTGQCLGARYGNNDAAVDAGDYLDATVTSYDSDGFTLNVSTLAQTEAVMYTAYRF